MGPLLHIKYFYLYTKIPLSFFKFKEEVIKGVKIFVQNIHLSLLSACEIKYLFEYIKQKFNKSKDFVTNHNLVLAVEKVHFFTLCPHL